MRVQKLNNIGSGCKQAWEKLFTSSALQLAAIIALMGMGETGWGQVTHIVISQVYGAGGNAGASYKRDYVELFNPTTAAVVINGWTIQYAAATGSSWTKTSNLPNVSIPAGKYYLVAMLTADGSNGASLPTADYTTTTNVDMSATVGKVALVNNNTTLTGTCPTGSVIVDFVGFGSTANCSETAVAPSPSATNAIFRASSGCTDSDNNTTDFTAAAASPRNSSTAANICSVGYFWNGGSTSSSPAAGGTGIWTATNAWRQPTNTGAQATWVDANIANLAGTAGTITLPGNISPVNTIIGTNGYTLTTSTTSTLSGTMALGGNIITTAPAFAQTLTLPGVISGTGGITQNGLGTTTLSGVNTYTGATTISAGTLSVATIGIGGVAGNLGQATNAATNLVLGGGTLQYTGSTASSDRNFTLTTGTSSTIDVTTNTLTISGGSASTTGALTKAGNGTLVLSGNNQYTGTTSINAGILQLGATGTSPNGPLGTITNGTTVSSGAVLDLNGFTLATAEPLTLAGTGISSSGALTNNGAAVSYSGAVTVGASTGVGGTGDINLTGVVSGAGSFTKLGAGTLTISGANTYSGATQVSVGTLKLNSTSALGTTAGGTAITSGAVLDLNGINYPALEALTISGTGITSNGTLINSSATAASFAGAITLNSANNSIGGTGDITLSGAIGTTNALTKIANNTLTLSGTSTYTGATTVSAGTLNLTGSLTSAISISSGATLTGTGSTSSTAVISGTISPAGTGIGTLTTGAQTWNSGGSYRVDLSNIAGSAGIDWDQLLISGSLTTPGSGSFTVSLYGTIAGGFVNTSNYTWIIGTYTGTNPSATNVFTTATGITNTLAGSFSISFSGNNIVLTYNASTGTITTTPASVGGPFCNTVTNNISVAYSITGSFTGTYKVQISDATGGFDNMATTGATIIGTGSGTSPISATIPAGLAGGTGYKVRVINDGPVTYGSDNGTAFTINAPPVIGTNADNVSVNSPAAASFSVSGVTGTVSTYLWQVSDDGGSTWSSASGGVYSGGGTAVLSISNSAGLNGNLYRVTVTGPCGTVTSTATLTVNTFITIWTNPITDSDPSTANPYTSGQAVASNISVSGIGRGTGITASSALNRYSASGWNSSSLDANDYFSFTITPNSGYKIDFATFAYTAQASGTGPGSFAIRSSIDGYTNDITTTPSSTGGTFSLADGDFQGITTTITFRIYAWGASASAGTFSVNDFSFDGYISAACNYPAVPVANGNTSPQVTLINPGCFAANWAAASLATSYLLDVSLYPTFTNSTPVATDLFISEYVEGSANNKYIEVFNGTTSSVNLSDYKLRLFSNGVSTPSQDVGLSGTLASGATIVYANAAATVYAGAVTVNAAVNFNGNDAIGLYKVSTSSYVDIFGRIGEDPGTAWTGGGLSTLDRTLVRKATVSSGITANPAYGFPTLTSTYWTGYNQNDVSDLGQHTFTGASTPSFITGYNSLSVAGTSTNVTGLTPGTNYYYRTRAVNGCGATSNSNVVSVTSTSLSVTDLRSRQTGNYSTAATWEYDPGCSVPWATSTAAPGGDNSVTILNSHVVTFDASGTINSGKTLTINSGCSLVMADKLLTGAGAFDLQSGGSLSIGDAAGITSSGATGNVRVSGSRGFSTSANYSYTNTGTQATGSGLPATVNHLSFAGTNTLSSSVTVGGTFTTGSSTDVNLNGQSLTLNGAISNAAGSTFSGTTSSSLVIGGSGSISNNLVFKTGNQNLGTLSVDRSGATITFGSPITVNTNLTLTNGLITTTAANLLSLTATAGISGGSSSSYINGPLRRFITTTPAAYFFPLGNAGRYKPLTFNSMNSLASGDNFTGEYKFTTPPEAATDYYFLQTLLGINNKEYWQFDRNTGNATGTLTLPYANPGSLNWRDQNNTPVSPCADCNVAVVKRSTSSGAGTWDYTATSSNFAIGTNPPEARTYSDAGNIVTKELSSFSPFTFGYGYSLILPVKLVSFAGYLHDNSGKLLWKVANLADLKGFELQYSTDGRNFSKLAAIPPSGADAYEYTHLALKPGANYYRLTVYDKNGSSFYSQLVVLTTGAVKTRIIGLKDNPVVSEITPLILSATGQQATATITDVSGRIVGSHQTNLVQGQNQWRMSAGQLPAAGLYFITIQTADGVKATLKFVK
jgi:autotransporter-associated beta strand protein